jgi:hypothetical protein
MGLFGRNRDDFGKDDVFGGQGGATSFEGTGFMTMAGSAACWDDIILPAQGLAQGVTAPTIAVSSNIRYYVLAGDTSGTADELHGVFEVPHAYKEGSTMYFHAHWFSVSAATGGVVLGVDYGIAHTNNSGIAYTTGVTALVRTIASDETGVMHINNVATISDANMKIGSNIMFRFYRPRIATNTHPDGIGILSLGVHFEQDTLGSRTPTTK